MLTGILKPSSGKILVAGKDPFINRKENAMRMGVLFGQRTQLWWDLPLIDTLELHRHMYCLTSKTYSMQKTWLFEVLDLHDISKMPIRQLSLGQRMRCELAVSLSHKPSILYLDEPTIGMDVLVKQHIREYLLKINEYENITILLTTHDLSEIENICSRVIVIHDGKLLFDNTIKALRDEYMPDDLVTIKYENILKDEIIHRLRGFNKIEEGLISFLMNRKRGEVSIISEIYRNCNVIDLKITEAPIEAIVRLLYRSQGKL